MMKKYILLLLVVMFTTACTEGGAKGPISNMAKALEQNDPELFLEQIDMKRYVSAQIGNQDSITDPIRTLDSLGKMFGINGIADMLGVVGDVEKEENARFSRGVSTGELMLMCKKSNESNCPWVPESLKNAEIIEVNENAAIAKVTVPSGISTWLALAKNGEKWKVVGKSALRDDATNYALGKKNENVPPHNIIEIPDAPAPPPPAKDKSKSDDVVRF